MQQYCIKEVYKLISVSYTHLDVYKRQGGHMVMGDYPYMISGVAMDEVVELLSPETFEAFDRLKDELIGPSEFQDLLQGGPRVFL